MVTLLAAALAACAGPAGAAAGSAGVQGMRWAMSGSDFEPAHMQGWVNLGFTIGPGTNLSGLAGLVTAWTEYGIPSLAYLEGGPHPQILQPGVGLREGWQAALATAVAKIKPFLGPDKAIRGVGLGDELCCRNTSCWQDYVPYTRELRRLIGPEALIYTNECWLGATPMANVTMADMDFDLFSVDAYQWDYRQPTIGHAEAAEIEALYTETIIPRLAAKTQVLLVPGVFGCSNSSAIGKVVPLEGTKGAAAHGQDQIVVDKLEGLFSWAKTEPRVGGFNPWHFADRGHNQAPGCPCDMQLGASSMPAVVAKLREINLWIMHNSSSDLTYE
jgi:hypothetical protein